MAKTQSHRTLLSDSPPKTQKSKQTNSSKSQLQSLAPRYQTISHAEASEKTDLAANTRKVKCDEARPECTPCSRLGHACDYNPRLSFKDDTPRVRGKVSDAAGAGGPVWDPSAARPFRRRIDRQQQDVSPPFFKLTNDEDREQKAEFRQAGTYNVIVNPESFVDVEEYKDFQEPPKASPSKWSDSVRSDRTDTDQSKDNEAISNENNVLPSDDPDIVILRTFEDDTQSLMSPKSMSTQSKWSRASTTPASSTISSTAQQDHFKFSYENTPLMKMANKDGRDHQLIYYYKNFVHRHLAQVHRDSLGTSLETGVLSAPDVFERQAANFLPLYHALMAFSALSMSYKNNAHHLDALQHYQQALPSLKASLKSEQDLTSDGVFLTHFILLLYEIAAGEPRGLSLWGQHIDQLLRIILLRRDQRGYEPYSFIVWWVAIIDTHVVLSGMGNGEFIEAMLRRNMLPSGMDPSHPYHNFHNGSSSTVSHREREALPSALAFHRRITILAAEIGLLARDLRAEEKRNPHDRSDAVVCQRQERIGTLQDTLRRTWNVQMPISVANGYCNQVLPVGARGIFEHSFALYRACLIYTHTSMYSTQRLHSPSSLIHEVSQCGGEILRLAREIVSNNHTERKFIVFPLFMSGFVSNSADDRREIVELMRKLEKDSVGRNFVAARQLLESVYERQERRREGWGNGREDVDWVGMIAELGLQVVNCRL